MASSVPPDTLGIHVINAGYGESIAISLPSGKWGVVDCYATNLKNPASNPTLVFLQEHGVTELEFLCITHPHRDHYKGASRLLESLNVRNFWRFGGLTREHLIDLLSWLKLEAKSAKDKTELECVNDLQKTLRIVSERRDSGEITVKLLSDVKHLYPLPFSTDGDPVVDASILSIAPSSNHTEAYQEKLKACFTNGGDFKKKPPDLPHNDLSVALLISFGKARVVLCGDVEESNWRDTLESIATSELQSNVVKVAHHGSATGYIPSLWDSFSAGGMTYAVIAPSSPHGLPKEECVNYFKKFAKVFTTCRDAVSYASREDFDLFEDYSLPVASALEVNLRNIRAKRTYDYGICSFYLDDTGECQFHLQGAAEPL